MPIQKGQNALQSPNNKVYGEDGITDDGI
jgi:hypothetical protein